MKRLLFILVSFVILYSGCKVPEGMIATNYDTFDLDVQLNYLAHDMVKSLEQEKKSKIAIMEFSDLHGNVSELGKFIPEELTTRLFMTRRFEVVERQLLNRVLEEQNLGITGLVDVSSAAQIGKMLGVEAIVTGTITDMGNSIRINARMIATETAGIFAVSSASIQKEEHITAMMSRRATSSVQSSHPNDNTQMKPAEDSSDAEPTNPKPSRASLLKTEVDGFELEFISGRLIADNRLVLEVSITNKSHMDSQLGIDRRDTKLYDNLGQEYVWPTLAIGSKKADGSWVILNHLFISDLPTKLRIEFNEIDPNIKSIALLNIRVGRNDAQFRNIEIDK